MKKISKILFGVLAIGLILFNWSFNTEPKATNSDISKDNLRLLKASAEEYFCDMTNSNCCDYPWVVSTGVLIVKI